jgi:Ca-activated chloride channel family protein
MLDLGSFGFKYAYVLILLPVLWTAFYYAHKNKQTFGFFLPGVKSIKEISTLRTIGLKYLPWLTYIGLSCLLIALARPLSLQKNEIINESGIDISLAIDLSTSMLAKDFKPNRLEVTKQLAEEFVQSRPNDRISIVAFAGEALSMCPLTYDHKMVVNILASLNQNTLTDGTAIGSGLTSSVNMLKDSKAKSKVIILLTDGVNTAGYIDPTTGAKLAAKYGIRVYVIGVGSEGQAETPVSRTPSGQIIYGYVPVEIDEPLMTEIANITNGQYFRAIDENSLQQIYNRINTLEKTKIEKNIAVKEFDEYRMFLIIGCLLLLLELTLSNTLLSTPIIRKDDDGDDN